jgi:F0F1-type ATP synthase assembly protein I
VGALLDAALGTGYLFVVTFGLIGFVAAVVALYYRYQAKIARDEEGKPWNRRQW